MKRYIKSSREPVDYKLAYDLIQDYYDTDPNTAYNLIYEDYGSERLADLVKRALIDEHTEKKPIVWYDEDDDFGNEPYTPSATRGDYSPSSPWNAPGMSVSDFI